MALLRRSLMMLLILLASVVPAAASKAIVVDWDAGLVYPIENGHLVRDPIITNNGRVLKDHYLGTFRISEKKVNKRSNMYNTHGKPIQPGQEGAEMRYWMRLGSSSQGLHHSTAFNSDGPRHRSNGCYRLSLSSAIWLFNWAPLGTRVYVVSSICDSGFAYLTRRCRRGSR